MKRLTEKSSSGKYRPIPMSVSLSDIRPWVACVERLAQIENILGDEYDIDRLKQLTDADKNGRCAIIPCKPGDDLYWYNDEECNVECQWQGVEGVVVLKDDFAVMESDKLVSEIGTQWTCLTAQECEEKYGVKPQNRHFIERFMEVK